MVGVPGSTGFFGSVGKDEFGAKLKACASADGVDVHYKEDAEAPTGEPQWAG
jgi:sugar/nucleoside kinase (ribokinase family)